MDEPLQAVLHEIQCPIGEWSVCQRWLYQNWHNNIHSSTLHRLADELAVEVGRVSVHLALLHGVLDLDKCVIFGI